MIYFIQMNDDGPIKIGVANDLSARLSNLQCGNPYPLKLLGCLTGGYKKEKELHEQFKEHRMRGEWFHPSEELLRLASLAKSPSELAEPDVSLDTIKRVLAMRDIGASYTKIGRDLGISYQKALKIYEKHSE